MHLLRPKKKKNGGKNMICVKTDAMLYRLCDKENKLIKIHVITTLILLDIIQIHYKYLF